MADETNQNQAGEVAPTTDQPVATDLPTANKPDSKATAVPPKREKPPAKAAAGEKPAATADGEEKPAAKAAAAKKEKAPAVEDKPFVEFIQQHYLPAVQTAITQQGVADLQLSFAKQKVPISGFESAEDCYQLVGSWQNGLRQFNLYFPDEDIQGKKGFSCNEGKKPSTLESFLIDERKITLDLLVFGLVQRLNGQKWLGRN
ncbi:MULTISPECIES: DUF2996 domain-containing protein [unclassified Tolypothrix]|uniref:DUF2996 domain-containing protein n=1 Tax=unclassified Tolypothrix TaxID=2649714 RepID=UPI0005EAACFE|nr:MULTISPECIES: DUF2996 domain-containing protein [unclassified Tolypothrix]BAY91924.1 hypothetical protein NIES3275_39520 [Microchaete diplosiphon NIES-3275]EKF04903.1 hypothetical protein FDUTEX481_01066 [Tolypothrix sp. PCC 7601]MBE9082704.1 DUF2996 domain-containing protein [Tolypothrix sp. LEGE 11397]UYD25924.1 DUF2996 domain-containing protein [Tolypothrix sp. PCC 7712]UYD31837.1 DUF2996 domain-containing protein [Tolypothrix sp. PCC 7601]